MPPDRPRRDEAQRDPAHLLDMLLAAQAAQSFLAGMDEPAFLASALHQSAVIRQLEIIGEAANRVSRRFQAVHPAIPWSEIIGMRHRLIHGYAEVRLDQVWRVVQHHLPVLEAQVRPLVPAEEPTEAP